MGDDGTLFSFVFIVGLIALIGVLMVAQSKQREREEAAAAAKASALRSAELAYQSSLRELETAPGNPGLRRQALALGRALAELQRESGAVSIYDEVAIGNDINAATGGTNALPQG